MKLQTVYKIDDITVIEGIVLQSFIYPHADQNLYDVFPFLWNTNKIFKEMWFCVQTIEVNRSRCCLDNDILRNIFCRTKNVIQVWTDMKMIKLNYSFKTLLLQYGSLQTIPIFSIYSVSCSIKVKVKIVACGTRHERNLQHLFLVC